MEEGRRDHSLGGPPLHLPDTQAAMSQACAGPRDSPLSQQPQAQECWCCNTWAGPTCYGQGVFTSPKTKLLKTVKKHQLKGEWGGWDE